MSGKYHVLIVKSSVGLVPVGDKWQLPNYRPPLAPIYPGIASGENGGMKSMSHLCAPNRDKPDGSV